MNSRIRKTIFFIVGIAALFVAAVCSVRFGSTNISGEKILQAILQPDWSDSAQIAILELRIPRTIGCIIVGAAFACAGGTCFCSCGSPIFHLDGKKGGG